MNFKSISDHFRNPDNVGEVCDPDGSCRSGSMTCGAVVLITLRIDAERKVTEAKFKAVGCSYLVAACSLLTGSISGKYTAEAAATVRSNAKDLFLEVLPENQHCLDLARVAILDAIVSYSDSVRAEWTGEDALICTCFGVSEHQIELAIDRDHLQSVNEVTRVTNAGAGCGSCYKLIEDILDDQHVRKMVSQDT